jgi:type III secretion inner rod protein HrpB2
MKSTKEMKMSNAIGNELIGSALSNLGQSNDATNESAAQKFQAMMDAQHLVPPSAQTSNGEASMFTQMVASHDAAAQHAMEHITEFSQRTGDMDVKQVIAESAQAAMEMYQVQFDFQAKMSVVSSSKSSAETLMKNQ